MATVLRLGRLWSSQTQYISFRSLNTWCVKRTPSSAQIQRCSQICNPAGRSFLKVFKTQTLLNNVSFQMRIGMANHVRQFHTSNRRNIPPVLWIFIKPVAKFAAALTGRSFRVWFRRQSPEQRQKFWSAVGRHWYVPTGLVVALFGSGAVYYYTHIEETPLTGRERFIAFTHEQIVKIAEEEAIQLVEIYKDKFYTEKDVEAMRVMRVANRLLNANPELKKMPFRHWEIYVINDPLVNACVLPSGHMFVFDGILQVANTDSQLAMIMGHEMAHAVLEHGVEELSKGRYVDVIVILCMAAIWCVIPSDGIALITNWFYNKVIAMLMHMPHSRQMEREADKVGLLFAARACYDVREGSVLWNKMSLYEKSASDNQGTLPEWMNTHPDSLKRAEHLDFLLPQAEVWRTEVKCPKLPPNDPREAIKLLSQLVDNLLLANKSGQDLRRAPRHPGAVVLTKTS